MGWLITWWILKLTKNRVDTFWICIFLNHNFDLMAVFGGCQWRNKRSTRPIQIEINPKIGILKKWRFETKPKKWFKSESIIQNTSYFISGLCGRTKFLKWGRYPSGKGGKVLFPVQIQDFTLDNLRPAMMGKSCLKCDAMRLKQYICNESDEKCCHFHHKNFWK